MKAFLDPRQSRHNPKHFIAQGQLRPSPEQPRRIEMLRAGAEAAGAVILAPEDHGISPIAAIHSAEYLAFLRSIHGRWQQMDGAGAEVIPNIHPRSRTDSYPEGAVGQAGYHQADTACPIGAETFEAAYWSAQSALSAAETVHEGASAAYALCRPPGHHAFADLAGGFCFLNNSAIAAQALLEQGHRPAILDVDLHHGNGTQGIFYARDDVLTLSIHADPSAFYPFFWGHAHERGEGAGRGANLNLPLPLGAGDAAFLAALEVALARIADFGADVLVVALGLDAYAGDPFKGLNVSTEGFHRIGTALRTAGLPQVIVQEGGYLCADLGHNLTAFLRGVCAEPF